MKKMLVTTVELLIIFYILICIFLYFFQEKLIFIPDKLRKDFKFSFERPFEEVGLKTKDGKYLNGLLFTSDSTKGLVFYLHGNAGALNTWDHAAKRYTTLNYDVFMFDYRVYGKSDGSIKSEAQFFEDIQTAYDEIKKRYIEENIIVLGYSIGVGAATKLASVNRPKLLILQAPYYSLTDLMRRVYPIIPTFLLKYKFETYKYLRECKMPIVVFHGNQDEVISYNSSLRLKETMKSSDTLITLNRQGHNGITDNPQYIRAISEILN